MDFESNEKVSQVLYIFIIGYEVVSHYLLCLYLSISLLVSYLTLNKFAKDVAQTDKIKDVWGKAYNIKFVLTNYQYLQTLDLKENGIQELVVPTIDF